MKSILDGYQLEGFYDEMFDLNGNVRLPYEIFFKNLEQLGMEDFKQRQYIADKAFLSMGITFNVYKQGQQLERAFPFDIIPRVISHDNWHILNKGIVQRVTALNQFIDDIYNAKNIIKDKVIPADVVYSSTGYLKQCEGVRPKNGRWTHVSGIDLIKHYDGRYFVLEDNLRVPSGVSYVLGNRAVMKRAFPDVFEQLKVTPIYDYPLQLLDTMQYLTDVSDPEVVVLTPGIYNSAYFEHSFLAQQMGVELVEGKDLTVQNSFCYMRTTKGLKKVDVIYRRIDTEYIDPTVFLKDSVLGVPGLFDAYRQGHVAIANAPGTGVADDKVVYAYVPDMIKYYLNEDPILPNVPTYLCFRDEDRKYVLDNLDKVVVKADNQSGGYGMLMGPTSTSEEQAEFKEKINKNPRGYIAQPVMNLSRVPTLVGDAIEGRHVDLRPFVLYGNSVSVLPGGLSRVALRKDSLIVNSSQGGGSKDTWVLRETLDKDRE